MRDLDSTRAEVWRSGHYGRSVPDHELTFTIGGVSPPADLRFTLAPTHPAQAGLLRGTLRMRDGVVSAIDPQPGALHRGAELLFAARDYRQALSLANRHDWQAPFFGEWALAQLVESALGIEVPLRAHHLRLIQAERTRIANHLAYLSHVAWFFDDATLATDQLREEIRQGTAAWGGHRVHPMLIRLGGIAEDLPAGWFEHEMKRWDRVEELAQRLCDAVQALPPAIAVIPPATVWAFGLSGPVARASGVTTDLRSTDPHLPSLLAHSALPTSGDATARFTWLAWELVQSVNLLRHLTDALADGPLAAHLPKVVKLPEGDTSATVEAPWGHASVIVTSRGDKTPWRLRLRTPSAANLSAWPQAIPGTRQEHLPTALASLPWVAGDLDK